jgi:hypothetical protein
MEVGEEVLGSFCVAMSVSTAEDPRGMLKFSFCRRNWVEGSNINHIPFVLSPSLTVLPPRQGWGEKIRGI